MHTIYNLNYNLSQVLEAYLDLIFKEKRLYYYYFLYLLPLVAASDPIMALEETCYRLWSLYSQTTVSYM